jgi:regulator of extracellular matrix RemA (YlzA/DUF370 family)
MEPKNVSYEYVENLMVVLKDNYIYRISDSIRLPISHKINQAILHNEQYKGSILYNTLQQRLINDKNRKNTLIDATKEYITKNSIVPYDESHLIVHLRSGDIIRQFVDSTNSIHNEINRILKENQKIRTIVIVTALHYGHPSENNNLYNAGIYSYNENSYKKNLTEIKQFINELKLPIILQSSIDIDVDFSKLISAKHLITSNGGFSKLVKELNEMMGRKN